MFSKIWHKYFRKDVKWAKVVYEDKRIKITDYNDAFIEHLKNELETSETDEDKIIQMYQDRQNIQQEEPLLEVVHSSVDAEGRVKVSLNWNKSFIRQLASNGITGETEDEAIHKYLEMVTAKVDDEFGHNQFDLTNFDDAFSDQDRELEEELKEAEKQVKRGKK